MPFDHVMRASALANSARHQSQPYSHRAWTHLKTLNEALIKSTSLHGSLPRRGIFCEKESTTSIGMDSSPGPFDNLRVRPLCTVLPPRMRWDQTLAPASTHILFRTRHHANQKCLSPLEPFQALGPSVFSLPKQAHIQAGAQFQGSDAPGRFGIRRHVLHLENRVDDIPTPTRTVRPSTCHSCTNAPIPGM